MLVYVDCGVSIGEDGPSQMALEDLAMFRSLPGCTVFYPSDAVATERAVELAANVKVNSFRKYYITLAFKSVTFQQSNFHEHPFYV